MHLTVIGAGYVGLVTAACFAKLGHSVHIINRDPKKALAIRAGQSPIYEPGLDELLRESIGKNLAVGNNYLPVTHSDISFICVGTPSKKDGSVDLSQIVATSQLIGEALSNRVNPHIVIVKSTVPPGTTEKVVKETILKIANRSNIRFAMNPEFLREGRAIEDFLHPDRIVIGCEDEETFNQIMAIYRGITAPFFQTNIVAAEMIKYASNAFLATKISYSNEIGNICKKLGIDVYDIMRGVGMDHRISPHFLKAGAGFGGSCLPKDVSALIHLASELDVDTPLLRAVMEVNDQQPLRMITLLEHRIGSLSGKRIAVLGLAFKDNTDDIRNSCAIPVIAKLLFKGALITAYDPFANTAMQNLFPQVEYCITAREALQGADACLIMTDWQEFKSLDEDFKLMQDRVIIEGRRILTVNRKEGICW